MKAIKNYIVGVVKEAKRIRWVKGDDFKSAFFTVVAYAIFFGLFLVVADFFVIKLLQSIKFK